MALMAVLRASSRCMASRLDFWTRNNKSRSPAKVATMMISRIVKPCLDFIIIIIP